jgi:hypothetical protein
MELLLSELKRLLSNIEKAEKKIEEISIIQKSQSIYLQRLKKQLEEVQFIPEWVPTNRALELLDIKKADTLRNYAKMGLITQRRAHDKRNYYPREEIFLLPQKLFDLETEKNE